MHGTELIKKMVFFKIFGNMTMKPRGYDHNFKLFLDMFWKALDPGYRIPEMTQNDPKDFVLFQNVLEKSKMSQKVLECARRF